MGRGGKAPVFPISGKIKQLPCVMSACRPCVAPEQLPRLRARTLSAVIHPLPPPPRGWQAPAQQNNVGTYFPCSKRLFIISK